MPRIQVEADLSPEELLEAAKQLQTDELGEFVHQISTLYAQRKAPSLPPAESDLLLKINEGLPEPVQMRFNLLRQKQQEGTLSKGEHEELLNLVELIENMDAQRVNYLAELAELRQISVGQLMKDLGINPPEYA